MPSKSEYMKSGLLSGLGRGLQQAGQMRFQTERDNAEDMRKRSLMELQDQYAVKNQDRKWERDDVTKAGDREYVEGQTKLKVKEWRNTDDGMQQGFNEYGEPVADATRPQTAAEVAANKAPGGTGAKYDSALQRDGRKLLGDDIFRKHAAAIKEKTGKDINFADFVIQNEDGTTTFNEKAIKSTFSEEIYNELVAKERLMEEAFEKGITSPRKALSYAEGEFDGMMNEQTTAAEKQQIDAISKQFGIPADTLKKIKTQPITEAFVTKAAEAYKNNPDAKQDLAAMRTMNPDLFAAVMERVKKNDPNTPGTYENPSQAEIDKVRGRTQGWESIEDGLLPGE